MDEFQAYVPTDRFQSVQNLLPNHFRFVIDALPDLSFFTQQVNLPDLMSGTPKQHTPFTTIPQVGDHLEFGSLSVSYMLDAAFKTYFSLFYWMRGYGFPRSYDDIANFITARKSRMGNPKPLLRDVVTTNAVLYITQPDTDSTVAEIQFSDVFPTQLSSLQFETGHGDEPLKAQVTFSYTDFHVHLTKP
jgi:hypothetical protein